MRSGNRSKLAAQKLAEMGYTNIYEFGGISTWDGGRIVVERETADEEFGHTTEKAVKSFQGKKNLTADGIIGSDTWKALLSA